MAGKLSRLFIGAADLLSLLKRFRGVLSAIMTDLRQHYKLAAGSLGIRARRRRPWGREWARRVVAELGWQAGTQSCFAAL